ncbi:GTPase Era [Thermodesulforhabdus norvegica]|uniref:GTPase Era n=1 Tax=Thermodesulforhabdus norvegica TaxID=39841 RepID=A0A1I4V6H5_9BACT|nr:GTPase Era [Thermodesulforhabdus norvegica]SFM96765.1 GTP-binding protein Era [Thermodesulforhabdus norvegica]
MTEGFRSGYVAILGAPNVGKSTLLNQILKEKISITCPKPQTTRNRIAGIYNTDACQIVFVDTPGIHQARDMFNKILVDTAISTLQDVDAVCFMIEATEEPKEIDLFVLDQIASVSTPMFLVINKIDLMKNKALLLPLMDYYSRKHTFEAIVPVSALLGDGVQDLLDEIKRVLPEGPKFFPEDYITDLPERFIVAEFIREKVFHLTREEVPYSVAVTVESFREDPDRKRIDIEATIHVERESQKGIIIGKGGRMLKEIGRLAREDIERFLGCHVYLSLFVRVQEKWRRDIRVLSEFGFRPPRKKKR